jgi:hypothetical protein
MHQRILAGATAVLSLALALAVPAVPSFAHGFGHGLAGKITQVSATSVTIQTSTGTVTEGLNSSTVVTKTATGSLSDLTKGTFVSVTLASGTTTVTAVHVAGKVGATTHVPKAGTPPASGTAGTRRTHTPRSTSGSTTSKPTTTTNPKAHLFAGGQVVSATGGKLVLQAWNGQQTTYTLGQNVTITKTVSGTLSDLHQGETVRLEVHRGSTTASEVAIVSG